MAENDFKVIYNSQVIKDISSFVSINNHAGTQNSRQVCFTVIAGVNNTFTDDIRNMDNVLDSEMNNGKIIYVRIKELSRVLSFQDTAFYAEQYENWLKSNKKTLHIKTVDNHRILCRVSNALQKTLTLFSQTRQVNPSLIKNFSVKLLYWFDLLFAQHTEQLSQDLPIKVVAQNIVKIQEYLFFYMLTQTGCNVMLLESEKQLDTVADNLKLSHRAVIGSYSDVNIPDYVRHYRNSQQEVRSAKNSVAQNRNVVVIPPRTERKKRDVQPSVNLPNEKKTTVTEMPPQIENQQTVRNESKSSVKKERTTQKRKEKSSEELAQLAKSVVMIAVHDKKGEIIGLGSGIMIGQDGYILTNNHVAKGGAYYSVHIEDDNETYVTAEVIKYHSVYDLAVIRIQKELEPIPIYKGRKELVRGQRVIAIGSPLGLFNSVSDGIISGFREVKDGVTMIQFTAPTSSGSSGGAVLNLYGEVIGISTAGIVEGQNINLAMDYRYINAFIKGII